MSQEEAYIVIYEGFHSHRNPQSGWFISWKTQNDMDENFMIFIKKEFNGVEVGIKWNQHDFHGFNGRF